MADNTQLNVGAGGDVIKTEDIGTFKIPVSKIYLGAAGIDDGPVTVTNPMPISVTNFPAIQAVSGSVTVGNFPTTQPVSGTVAVSNLPATQAVTVGNFPATQPVSGSVIVSGSVSVGNFPATQPVSAASLPLPTGAATAAKQPALGTSGTPSTDVLSVQGIAGGTPQPISGSVSVSNFPATQPVSGSVSVGNFPATQAVSGSVSVGNFPATQAITAAVLPLPTGAATAAKQPAIGAAGTPAADVLTVQGAANMTALKVDGSAATQPVSGSVAVSNFPATQPVTVGNFPATQPVSGSVSVGNFPATQPVSGTVSVSGVVSTLSNLNVAGSAVTAGNPVPVSMASGTSTIGGVISQLATGIIYSGTAALTPKFASISGNTLGDNLLVAAVAGKRIRVLKYSVVTSGAVALKFRSATTDLTGPMSLVANSGVGAAFSPVGQFETAIGEALNLNLSSTALVAGHLTYIEV